MSPSRFALCLLGLTITLGATYPTMAPLDQYLMPRDAEIALARTAAPPSISNDAGVMVLTRTGYEQVSPSKNGFICFVMRSWFSGFNDPEFWNQKERSPNCYNAGAVRTEWPQGVQRTKWVLAGMTREQIIEKTKAAFASGTFKMPVPGAFSFMLSKQGYLGDNVGGPWLPHVMFFVAPGQGALWGAGMKGSPIIGQDDLPFESTVYMIPVRRWSDGSMADAPPQHM